MGNRVIRYPVIKNCAYCLAHTPDLVRYGSKPRREIAKDPGIEVKMDSLLRNYSEAVCYPPNQTFLGNLSPDELATLPRPWYMNPLASDSDALQKRGLFGEILDQKTFYALLLLADVLSPPLFHMQEGVREKLQRRVAEHHLLKNIPSSNQREVSGMARSESLLPPGLPLRNGEAEYGYFLGDLREEARGDSNLQGPELLENICTKASAALALQWLLHREGIEPGQIDFLISCGEEACGDRYQRGGGGMAKAIGEMCGCLNAAGMDIKNFCAAPVSALVTAGSLVQSGVFKRVAVVGGGSLAKLGMKSQAFLQNNMVILDDTLASMAFLVSEDDQKSPIIRLEQGAVGTVPIGAGSAEEEVFRHYLLKPLENLGLQFRDIDKFAPELQNPEIMEFAGSGDVAMKNYRKIAAMAVRAGQMDKSEMGTWINKIGMPGFAPTQGHIPSAVPYIGHAMEAMKKGEIKRVMFLARASLFLNRCTNLLDGVSFIMERNPALSGK